MNINQIRQAACVSVDSGRPMNTQVHHYVWRNFYHLNRFQDNNKTYLLVGQCLLDSLVDNESSMSQSITILRHLYRSFNCTRHQIEIRRNKVVNVFYLYFFSNALK